MSGDAVLEFSNKLTGEWSASSVTGLLSEATIASLAAPQQWEALDPLVRARLVLSPLFLRAADLKTLGEPLRKLKAVAAADRDEWVRVLAAAVGGYDGRLHMEEVAQHSKVVETTLEDVRRLGAGADTALYRPLEASYFIFSGVALASAAAPFFLAWLSLLLLFTESCHVLPAGTVPERRDYGGETAWCSVRGRSHPSTRPLCASGPRCRAIGGSR